MVFDKARLIVNVKPIRQFNQYRDGVKTQNKGADQRGSRDKVHRYGKGRKLFFSGL
jgi:hypothetical protein